jgi:hypothetical protein
MNPSNANNKTLFTPESAEAKLADMQQRVLAKYTGPDATQPITGAGCDASINECEHWLRVEGQVDEYVLVKRTLLVEGYVNRPNAPPSHGTADNVPDQHDEADFDIPDTQSVLETFMSKFLETFSHPMLQFLPQKLAEWIANNYAEELNVPLRSDPTQPWSTPTLNRILQTCLVSDRKGNTIHTFQTIEFESDLYSRVMCARCYPFYMERHQFRGRNVKVCTYTWYILCI